MEYLILLAAPLIGLLVGILPALGATLAMLLLYPFLLQFDPFVIIVFYCIVISSKEFSGSVSAISFNLMGEVTSAPVLTERPLIVKENLQINALRNTMIGSVCAMLFGIGILYVSLLTLTNYKWLLRTDVIAMMLTVCMLMLFQHKTNTKLTNLCLILFGFQIGQVGYNHYQGTDFLTFGNPYLSGGIPMLAFVFGVYALPKLYEMWTQTKLHPPDIGTGGVTYPISKRSIMRGSAIGSVFGLIPFVGTTISSHVAHYVEGRLYTKNSGEHALARITAAESANNAGVVTVLIPLLVLGLAIQPSEFVVVDMLQQKQWQVSQALDSQFLLLMLIAMPMGCLITSLLCYNFVRIALDFLYRNISIIFFGVIAVSLANIMYSGVQSDQMWYYFIVFLISSVLGFFAWHRRIDMMPCVVVFLLENNYSDVITRLPSIYGF